ncbi:MAG: GspE/PulE family protein [Treponema sp.]|jgi:general secretion pathway protein E/type IV pilus assembly protein PilB|nr:GspE/PulE family protein [Treponema sp.]
MSEDRVLNAESAGNGWNGGNAVKFRNFHFESDYGEQYQKAFMLHRCCMKLSETETKVTIGVVEGSGRDLLRFLEAYHMPKQTAFVNIGKSEFASFAGTLGCEASVNGGGKTGDSSFALEHIEEDAPVINIINALCIDAIKMGASDIHIEALEKGVQIRYRIDGVLRPVKLVAASLFRQLSNRIKVMSGLNSLEQRLPQDGRMTVSIDGAALDLRVSIVPTSSGESIVLRLFRGAALELDELGFVPEQLYALRNAARLPYGLALVSGPTGSGKTTTLHALLRTLPAEERKIITIEDPVELRQDGINQIQINEAISLGFDGMLRRVLRQDPDVIMVGEIRDEATAELALRAALTGHLILSTLHTNDSVSVIPRLIDMGLEPYLIASSLRCSAAQRLVRKLCPCCSREVKPDKRAAPLLRRQGINAHRCREKNGCDLCAGTGYLGRTVVGEVFKSDRELEALIERRADTETLRSCIAGRGFRSMETDGLEKYAAGITDFEELEREILCA